MENISRPINPPSFLSALYLDRTSDVPIVERLYEALRAKMAKGELKEGTKLPPTRAFATELGVSRTTVVNAYDQLVAEGYVESRQGSGHRVCGIGEVELNTARRPDAPAEKHRTIADTGIFQIGQPDMRLFPHRLWAQTVARVCRNAPEALLSSGDPFGSFALRQALARHVSEWRGIAALPDQILITSGSTDAFDICLRTLTELGQAIALENPGYKPLRSIAHTQGRHVIDLAIDGLGATLPPKGSQPRLAVLTPSHQFPLGGAMSPGRRQAYKDWAVKNGGWVIEDDYDSEFRFAGRPIPAMACFDANERTIYLGSFSKVFSNALRIGYVIVPLKLVDSFRSTVRLFSSRASHMPQQALADFIDSGSFYRHLRRMRRIYGERRKYLVDQFKRDFADIGTFQNFNAGMHIVLNLEDRYIDTEIVEHAAKQGLSISALSSFSCSPNGLNGLAFGYCGNTEQELTSGLAKIQNLIRR